jgi:hypothetical protein
VSSPLVSWPPPFDPRSVPFGEGHPTRPNNAHCHLLLPQPVAAQRGHGLTSSRVASHRTPSSISPPPSQQSRSLTRFCTATLSTISDHRHRLPLPSEPTQRTVVISSSSSTSFKPESPANAAPRATAASGSSSMSQPLSTVASGQPPS